MLVFSVFLLIGLFAVAVLLRFLLALNAERRAEMNAQNARPQFVAVHRTPSNPRLLVFQPMQRKETYPTPFVAAVERRSAEGAAPRRLGIL